MDYDADVSIDEQALDVEWLEHPSLMGKYCSLAAAAQRDLDLAKERLDVVDAEISHSVRSDPGRYGISKITEDLVKSTVLVQPEHQEASQDFILRKYEHAMAQGAVRAFEHRKSALENLVRLHGQSYFAGPSVPHDLSDERQRRDSARRARDTGVQGRVRGLQRHR